MKKAYMEEGEQCFIVVRVLDRDGKQLSREYSEHYTFTGANGMERCLQRFMDKVVDEARDKGLEPSSITARDHEMCQDESGEPAVGVFMDIQTD